MVVVVVDLTAYGKEPLRGCENSEDPEPRERDHSIFPLAREGYSAKFSGGRGSCETVNGRGIATVGRLLVDSVYTMDEDKEPSL